MPLKHIAFRLPVAGRIKAGNKGKMITSQRGNKFQPPQKLDHFQITTNARGEDGNFLRDNDAHATIGDKPTEIPIYLLSDDPETNFATRMVFYGKDAAGKLRALCVGDGAKARRTAKDGTAADVACPCPLSEPDSNGLRRCKPNGILRACLGCRRSIGAVHEFRTTSFYSCTGIRDSLLTISGATSGVLAGIPLVLCLQPKQTDRGVVYVAHVELRAASAGLLQAAIAERRALTSGQAELLALRNGQVKLLAPGDEDEAETREVVEEFAPEALDGEMPEPAQTAPAVETTPAPATPPANGTPPTPPPAPPATVPSPASAKPEPAPVPASARYVCPDCTNAGMPGGCGTCGVVYGHDAPDDDGPEIEDQTTPEGEALAAKARAQSPAALAVARANAAPSARVGKAAPKSGPVPSGDVLPFGK